MSDNDTDPNPLPLQPRGNQPPIPSLWGTIPEPPLPADEELPVAYAYDPYWVADVEPPPPPKRRRSVSETIVDLLGGTDETRRGVGIGASWILAIIAGFSTWIIVWSRLHYHLPHQFAWVTLVFAFGVGVAVLLFCLSLMRDAAERRLKPAQEAATCDEEHRYVSLSVVERCKHFLKVDEEHPELTETTISWIQRDHPEALLHILWLPASLTLGGIGFLGGLIRNFGITPPLWTWLWPLSAATWTVCKAMTDWYYCVYFTSEYRVKWAQCPPLPFNQDSDQFELGDMTNAEVPRRRLSRWIDSRDMSLEGRGDSNQQQNARWDRMRFMRRAEALKDHLTKLRDRLRYSE